MIWIGKDTSGGSSEHDNEVQHTARLRGGVSQVGIFYIHSFPSAVYLTTGPQPLPKRVLHTVLSNAFSFNFQHPLVSLKSFNSCLRLLPRLTNTLLAIINT